MKIAVFMNGSHLSGKLTRFFTGCTAYHIAFFDPSRGSLWDMHLIRRRRRWPYSKPGDTVLMFDCPAPVTPEYLESRLETDGTVYGWRDYLLFAIRPLYHLFGRSTRNVGGMICSEMVNNDLIAAGWQSPWPTGSEPPSPCDFLQELMVRGGIVETPNSGETFPGQKQRLGAD